MEHEIVEINKKKEIRIRPMTALEAFNKIMISMSNRSTYDIINNRYWHLYLAPFRLSEVRISNETAVASKWMDISSISRFFRFVFIFNSA